ncbi:MAG: XRE family transcriptional regulator [Alphaproteobacteria bacterium]|nr:XRE family transcriptional regulator [Alphaproteobacteria bacterium]
MKVNVNQIRAARGLLGWSQKELAARSGISDVSIINYENGKRTPHQNTLEKIMRAFEMAGVEFTEDGGIRPRQSRVITFEGREGFRQFFDDIYETAKSSDDPDLCTTNHVEDVYDHWLGDYEPIHNKRMTELKDIKVRVLLKEGDKHLTSTSYADYRWVKNEFFSDVSLYVYGKKVAFVDFFEDNVIVTVVESERAADSVRKMFSAIWSISLTNP